jgi:hypothetical protein
LIRVYDAAPERLVLDIPQGKKTGGLGCFVVVWNGFLALLVGVVIAAPQNLNVPEWTFALILTPFWLIGLGLLYAWIRLRFERSFLLVERNRAVQRRMLFGREKQREIPLDAASRAELTEAYRENQRPVYRVTLVGAGNNSLHFGTAFEAAEKDWCVDAINALLQPRDATDAQAAPAETLCEACGAAIPPDAFRSRDGSIICPACEHEQLPAFRTVPSRSVDLDQAAVPDELPAVAVLEDSVDRLGLRLAVTEMASVRGLIAIFGAAFAAIWYSVIGIQFGNSLRNLAAGRNAFEWFSTLFLVPFLIAGLIPLGMVLLAVWGRLTTWIDRNAVVIRLHVGPFGRSWRMNTANVTAVRLMDSNEIAPGKGRNPRIAANARARGQAGFDKVAAVCAGSRVLAMTGLHRAETATFVAHKVRRWLKEYAGATLA